MVLVTQRATFPVGFRFYVSDPRLSAWRKEDKSLKQRGVAKCLRPKRPVPDHLRYPTLQALALEMIEEFVTQFPELIVKGVLADALYGTGKFMDKAAALTGAQVISQLRSNQIIASRNSQALDCIH